MAVAVGAAGPLRHPGGVNLGAHMAVAALARPGASLDLLAGSALPDVASMGRVRLQARPQRGTDLAEGVDLHHRTDSLFHRHPWFTDLSQRVTAALTGNGVARGPARAVGHVGVELLLDGRLLAEPDHARLVGAGLASLAPPDEQVVALVAPEHHPRWRLTLERVASHRPPAAHHQPAAVADRLHRMLAHRRRLALPGEAVATVATVLAAHRNEIDDGAESLVVELADQLG